MGGGVASSLGITKRRGRGTEGCITAFLETSRYRGWCTKEIIGTLGSSRCRLAVVSFPSLGERWGRSHERTVLLLVIGGSLLPGLGSPFAAWRITHPLFSGGKGVNRNYVSIQCKPKGVPNFESKLTVIKRGARRSGRCGRGGRESIRFNTNRRESFYGGYCSGVEGVRSKVEKRVKRESEKDKWTGLY